MTTQECITKNYKKPIYWGIRSLRKDSSKRGYTVSLNKQKEFTVGGLTLRVDRRDGRCFNDESRTILEDIAKSNDADGLLVSIEGVKEIKYLEGNRKDDLDKCVTSRTVDVRVTPYFLE